LSTPLPRHDKSGTATEDNNDETALEWRCDRSHLRACDAGIGANHADEPVDPAGPIVAIYPAGGQPGAHGRDNGSLWGTLRQDRHVNPAD
jgi:hypothetical protein